MLGIIDNKKGIALIVTYVVITVLLVSAGPFFWRSFNEFRFANRQKDETKAYYIAEAGLALVAMEIYQKFAPLADTAWMTDTYAADFKDVVNNYNFPTDEEIESGTELRYTVVLPSNPYLETSDGVLLKLIAVGRVPHLGGEVRKVVASTIFYEMKQSPVFNYAYFINNSARIDGKGIIANGDVRSNGNFSFNNKPRINGDIYASENPVLETAGTINGKTEYWDILAYQDNAPARARPTNPTGSPNPGGEVYDAGYDGESDRYGLDPSGNPLDGLPQEKLDMPYLGDLAGYELLANNKNGQIIQDKKVLVDNVYDGNGPDGKNGTPDDGCIVLIGTDKEPIVINGPVVVKGDVIITGVISGQGTIYAGRNIHILGDVTYNAPPSWPKPDSDPYTTAQANQTKDFVAFAVKGNVIMGDYTTDAWKKSTENYLRPPFTQGYAVDKTDVALGYDSDGDPTNGYWFNGDYTAYDTGYKDDGIGGSAARRFYESSLSDDYINSIAGGGSAAPGKGKKPEKNAAEIKNIDGILYNNHALAGKVGDCTFNGSVVSRDEVIIYKNGFIINYDVRAHAGSIDYIDLNLPRSLVLPETKARQSG